MLSVSYGSVISTTCLGNIWGGICTDKSTYITQVNQGLQKLALLGVSVIVAAGDQGAPNYDPVTGGFMGYCPTEPSRSCVAPLTSCTGDACYTGELFTAQSGSPANFSANDGVPTDLTTLNGRCAGPASNRNNKCAQVFFGLSCNPQGSYQLPTSANLFPMQVSQNVYTA